MYSYFCKPIYNICNPTAWNMGETLMWQLGANTCAQMPLFNVTTLNYSANPFTCPCGGDLNSVFSNIMQNTMQQFNWQMQNGGMNFGGFNIGNWFGGGAASTTPTSNLSTEEKAAKAKFDKLQNLITVYKANYPISDDTLNAEIKTAMKKDSKDTWVQAYDKLTAVYKKLNQKDPNGLRATLTILDKDLSLDGDPLTHNYKEALKNGGYDYSSTNVVGAPKLSVNITDLHTAILEPKLEEGKNKPSGDYYPELPLSTAGVDNNILTVLSAWNNTYGKTNGGKEKSIIRVFVNIVNASNKKYSDNVCSDYITANIRPFTNALKHKGEYAADNLKYISDSERQQLKSLSLAINNDIEKVQDSGKNKATLTTSLNQLVTDFDKLYVALRLAEAKNAQKMIENDYIFLNSIATDDTDIVDNKIVENTKADLRAEGYTDSDINGSKVDLTPAHEDEAPVQPNQPVVNGNDSTEVSNITPETIAEHTEYSEANSDQLAELKMYLKNDTNGKQVAAACLLTDAQIDAISKAYVNSNDNYFYIFLGNVLTKINYTAD